LAQLILSKILSLGWPVGKHLSNQINQKQKQQQKTEGNLNAHLFFFLFAEDLAVSMKILSELANIFQSVHERNKVCNTS
jgi:hypothetical protein